MFPYRVSVCQGLRDFHLHFLLSTVWISTFSTCRTCGLFSNIFFNLTNSIRDFEHTRNNARSFHEIRAFVTPKMFGGTGYFVFRNGFLRRNEFCNILLVVLNFALNYSKTLDLFYTFKCMEIRLTQSVSLRINHW